MEQHCAWRLWVIEYAWAHNMINVFQDVGALYWPDGDWEILSLDESWYIRVVSAQVYNIVKSRQTHHYEKVLAFLEHTHTLLPTLVPAIKHMKIVFGLKTMVIMGMLREGIGPISVVQKIIKYFPSKLPQYEDHCRKHEMFLMRRNQLDFRTFAQSLVMDKQKLEDYIQETWTWSGSEHSKLGTNSAPTETHHFSERELRTQLSSPLGVCIAPGTSNNHVEEHYGDHYAQKTEERLLHYLRQLDKALPKCTYIDQIIRKNSPVKEWEKSLRDLITDDFTATATSLKTLLQSDATCCYSLNKSHLETRTASCMFPESRVGTSKEQLKYLAEKSLELDSPVTMIVDADGPRKEPISSLPTDQTNKTTCVSAIEVDNTEESCVENSSIQVSSYFCTTHQRWVRNILSECPVGSSEEQPLQEISPPLFTPSSSSSDLTLSNLTICTEHHLSPPASSQQPEAEEDPKTVEKHFSEAVDMRPPLHPSSPAAQSLIPAGRVLKVVIVPCSDVTPVTVYPLKSSARPDLQLCNNENSTTVSSTLSNCAKLSMHQTVTSSKPFISKLSRRFKLGQRFSQSQKPDHHNKAENGANKVQCLANSSSASHSTHSTSGIQVSNYTQKNNQAQSSSMDHMASCHDGTTFSYNHIQPCVVLKRMSREECLKLTKGRLQYTQCDDMEAHSDPDIYIFDVNSLYSNSSSEEETADSDTEYRPSRKTLRTWRVQSAVADKI